MSAPVVNLVRRGFYLDSVALMRLSRSVAAMDGVEEAALMMGTPANQGIMADAGLLAADGEGARGGDLVIAIRASTAAAAAAAAAEAAASARDDGFVPPPPVEPDRRPPLATHAEPFAAAAMTNGAKAPPESRRGPTLFERVTGAGRTRQPRAEPKPVVEAAPASASADNLTLAQVETDPLDIPAFLRRQAN